MEKSLDKCNSREAMYGWFEAGGHSGTLYNNTVGTQDVVLRSAYNGNKIVIGNQDVVGNSAALYVQSNNVGVRRVPRSAYALDVTGNCALIGGTIQLGSSNMTIDQNGVLRGDLAIYNTVKTRKSQVSATVTNATVSGINTTLTMTTVSTTLATELVVGATVLIDDIPAVVISSSGLVVTFAPYTTSQPLPLFIPSQVIGITVLQDVATSSGGSGASNGTGTGSGGLTTSSNVYVPPAVTAGTYTLSTPITKSTNLLTLRLSVAAGTNILQLNKYYSILAAQSTDTTGAQPVSNAVQLVTLTTDPGNAAIYIATFSSLDKLTDIYTATTLGSILSPTPPATLYIHPLSVITPPTVDDPLAYRGFVSFEGSVHVYLTDTELVDTSPVYPLYTRGLATITTTLGTYSVDRHFQYNTTNVLLRVTPLTGSEPITVASATTALYTYLGTPCKIQSTTVVNTTTVTYTVQLYSSTASQFATYAASSATVFVIDHQTQYTWRMTGATSLGGNSWALTFTSPTALNVGLVTAPNRVIYVLPMTLNVIPGYTSTPSVTVTNLTISSQLVFGTAASSNLILDAQGFIKLSTDASAPTYNTNINGDGLVHAKLLIADAYRTPVATLSNVAAGTITAPNATTFVINTAVSQDVAQDDVIVVDGVYYNITGTNTNQFTASPLYSYQTPTLQTYQNSSIPSISVLRNLSLSTSGSGGTGSGTESQVQTISILNLGFSPSTTDPRIGTLRIQFQNANDSGAFVAGNYLTMSAATTITNTNISAAYKVLAITAAITPGQWDLQLRTADNATNLATQLASFQTDVSYNLFKLNTQQPATALETGVSIAYTTYPDTPTKQTFDSPTLRQLANDFAYRNSGIEMLTVFPSNRQYGVTEFYSDIYDNVIVESLPFDPLALNVAVASTFRIDYAGWPVQVVSATQVSTTSVKYILADVTGLPIPLASVNTIRNSVGSKMQAFDRTPAMWTLTAFNVTTSEATFTLPYDFTTTLNQGHILQPRIMYFLPLKLDTTVYLGNSLATSVHLSKLIVGNKTPEASDPQLSVIGAISLKDRLTMTSSNGPLPFTMTYDGATTTVMFDKGLQVDGRLKANEFLLPSDRRLKNNIVPDDGAASMSDLRKLQPQTFKFIDEERFGAARHIGFIAQDVEEHLPDMIQNLQDFIPNMMKWGCVDANGFIRFQQGAQHSFRTGDTIKFKISTQTFPPPPPSQQQPFAQPVWLVAQILEQTPTRIKLNFPLNPQQKVFIYGSWDYYKVLNYNAITMKALSALRYLAETVEQIKAKVDTL